jgi:hypothetical protein
VTQPRRALIGAGLGFAASMLVLAAALLIARNLYLNSVPAGMLPPDAAAAAFDILVRLIKTALRTLLVAGLAVAAGAFFTGRPQRRSEPAARCRLAWAGSATADNPDRLAGGSTHTGARYASGRSRWPR